MKRKIIARKENIAKIEKKKKNFICAAVTTTTRVKENEKCE